MLVSFHDAQEGLLFTSLVMIQYLKKDVKFKLIESII